MSGHKCFLHEKMSILIVSIIVKWSNNVRFYKIGLHSNSRRDYSN